MGQYLGIWILSIKLADLIAYPINLQFMSVNYRRKLYVFLQNSDFPEWGSSILDQLNCLASERNTLEAWWQEHRTLICDVASSSDRLDLPNDTPEQSIACHPISGQKHTIPSSPKTPIIPSTILEHPDPETVYWWFWRFYPEWRSPQSLLDPAHTILPDCPLHSYQTAVSAFATTCTDAEGNSTHPYLLLFSFSPIQDFIKASRKFLDFWAGSYLLHYLSACLCWNAAQTFGPDAIITPSLWSQEIIDAFLLKKYPDFSQYFQKISADGLNPGLNPISRWDSKSSTSLNTAGFPNTIVILVPTQAQAQELGKQMSTELTGIWVTIAEMVRNHIRGEVSRYAKTQLQDWDTFKAKIKKPFSDSQTDDFGYKDDLEKWSLDSNWEWRSLWDTQINNSWEPYWSAIPLGKVGQDLEVLKENECWNEDWLKAQQAIAQDNTIPTKQERDHYKKLNVGTWWGSIQQRLGNTLKAVKAQRNWQIPIAPGNRSSISGQYSAVHPRLNHTKFGEGAGLPEGKMRFFWWTIAQVYPGLFDGTEQLNALELTKRMAWGYGGVTESLGISSGENKLDYENLVRFPNASSIAAARFAYEAPEKMRDYWNSLKKAFDKGLKSELEANDANRFEPKTTRPFQILQTDRQIRTKLNRDFNGVMFSAKWLAEDMNLSREHGNRLRQIVDQTHKELKFGEGSPADWWVMLLADGDGMGGYVSGQKLEPYRLYVPEEFHEVLGDLGDTTKRMGPATHIGLNRALLDFSNRLVPYLTEQRFCGKVVYSGGDDVMALLPLEDLPEYLRSLRAAWSGSTDPGGEFDCGTEPGTGASTGYWQAKSPIPGLPDRPLFTMGKNATLSAGIVIAHKSVPLPTVLESLWTAEKEGAKALPDKDGLCFRVIYGNGNQLEALMPGQLLDRWWDCIKGFATYGEDLAPVLYRLSEELPKRALIDETLRLIPKAAEVILNRREAKDKLVAEFDHLQDWLTAWEDWAIDKQKKYETPMGTELEDLGNLLRFTAFWVDKRVERHNWCQQEDS
jgi:CRISPR-associated protein Cmr2